jgi:hypothetical protein
MPRSSTTLRPFLTPVTDPCRRLSSPLKALYEAREVEDLDAWLAQLETTARGWLEAVVGLLEAQVEGTAEVADYRRRWLSSQSPDAVFSAFSSARKHHDILRETMVSECR